jgi:hypothetical protein
MLMTLYGRYIQNQRFYVSNVSLASGNMSQLQTQIVLMGNISTSMRSLLYPTLNFSDSSSGITCGISSCQLNNFVFNQPPGVLNFANGQFSLSPVPVLPINGTPLIYLDKAGNPTTFTTFTSGVSNTLNSYINFFNGYMTSNVTKNARSFASRSSTFGNYSYTTAAQTLRRGTNQAYLNFGIGWSYNNARSVGHENIGLPHCIDRVLHTLP